MLGAGVQTATADNTLDQMVQARLLAAEWFAAGLEVIHPFLVDVDANDLEAGVRDHGGDSGPDVPEADNADHCAPLFDAAGEIREQSVQHRPIVSAGPGPASAARRYPWKE